MSDGDEKLPEGWVKKYNEQHKRHYYQNLKTKKTQWNSPEVNVTNPSSTDDEWEEKYSSEHKRKFWRNLKTNKTTWTDPKATAGGGASASTPAADEKDVWEERYSDQYKRKFWKNKNTGKTMWSDPRQGESAKPSCPSKDGNDVDTEELIPDEDWEEKYSDQHKRKFWKNKKTGKSSWTEPPKVKKKKTSEAVGSTGSSSHDDELVPDEDWEEKYSDKHKRKFWKNKKTGKSSWTEPPKVKKKKTSEAVGSTGSSSHDDELVPDEDWEEKYSDKHKRKFWKNKKTGKSSWTEPPKVKKKKTSEAVGSTGSLSHDDELVPDEDWEEKYSDKHKRKFWKNKKTGKSSWTEPPKVKKHAVQPLCATTSDAESNGVKSSVTVERSAVKEGVASDCGPLVPGAYCGYVWEQNGKTRTCFLAKLCSGRHSSVIFLYPEMAECSLDLTAHETAVLQGQEASTSGSTNNYCDSSEKIHLTAKENNLKFPVRVICLNNFQEVVCNNEAPGVVRLRVKSSLMNDSTVNRVEASNSTVVEGLSASVVRGVDETSSVDMKDDAVAAGAASEANRLTGSEISTDHIDVILMCESKEGAQSWAKAIGIRCKHIQVCDETSTCNRNRDVAEMSCMMASELHKKSTVRMERVQECCDSLSLRLSSLLKKRPGSHVLTSLLHRVEDVKSEVSIAGTCPSDRGSAEGFDLPNDGLVVVSMQYMNTDSTKGLEGSTFLTDTSLWVHIDVTNRRLVFYDHGPDNSAYMVVYTNNAYISLLDLSFSLDYCFDIVDCTYEERSICIRFIFTSAVQYWKWAVSTSRITTRNSPSLLKQEEIHTSDDVYKQALSASTHQSSLISNPMPHTVTDVIWSDFMLDFALDSIGFLAERNMVRRMMKRYDVSGADIRKMKFFQARGRIVVTDPGKTNLLEGSIVVSVNQISAIGMPGRALVDMITEIPVHVRVELWAWEFPRSVLNCSVMILSSENSDQLGNRTTGKRSELSNTTEGTGDNSFEEQKIDICKSEYTNSVKDVTQHNEFKPVIGVNGDTKMPSTSAGETQGLWNHSSRVQVEGGLLKVYTTRGLYKQKNLNLADVQMRLVEARNSTGVAIELRDKSSHIALECSTLKVVLRLCIVIVEALRLAGAVPIDLESLHARCWKVKKSNLSVKTSPSGGDINTLRLRTPNKGSSGAVVSEIIPSSPSMQSLICGRAEVIKAAQALESTLDALCVTGVIPTVAMVFKTLRHLEEINTSNHKLLCDMISFELSLEQEEKRNTEEYQTTDSQSSGTAVVRGDTEIAKNEEPTPVFDKGLPLSIPPKGAFNPIRRSMSQGPLRNNSLMDQNSPIVFVPPADSSKERRIATRSVITPSRRSSTGAVTPTTVLSALPEEDMQPLLAPLQVEEKGDPSVEGNTGDGAEGGEIETEAKTTESPKRPSEVPELEMVSTTEAEQTPDAVCLNITEDEVDLCASLVFFIREHPDILIDFSLRCTDVQELMDIVRLAISRIYAHWSCDDVYLEEFMKHVVSNHFRDVNNMVGSERNLQNDIGYSLSRTELLPLTLDELCRRADIIGFIRHISDAVGQTGRIVINSGGGTDISVLCAQVVEPICHRFDTVASSGKIPRSLRCVIRAFSTGEKDAMGLLADSLVPKLAQWLNSASHSDFDTDAVKLMQERRVTFETVQELLKLCFCSATGVSSERDPGYRVKGMLSLYDSAVLSRSKWLIARFIEECTSHPPSLSNKLNPIRLIADMRSLKPAVCESAISLGYRDMWVILSRCSEAVISTYSPWGGDVSDVLLGLEGLRTRYDADTWLKSTQSFVLRRQQNLYSPDREEQFQALPGCRELTNINWIVNAAKSVLRYLYDADVNLPNGMSVMHELNTLHQDLIARKHLIECCIKDMICLRACEELSGIYRSEITLLFDLLKRNSGNEEVRTEGECIFALSKLCHRQFEKEVVLSGGEDRDDVSAAFSSPQRRSTPNDTPTVSTPNTSANPLWLVMRNVFPSDDLNKSAKKY